MSQPLRHKWKKLSDQPFLKKGGYEHQAKNCMICINCQLMKGIVRTLSFFPKLVYFKGVDIISVDKIPFRCIDENLETVKEDMFLTEKDFEVD